MAKGGKEAPPAVQASASVADVVAADKAREPKTVRMVVTYGGILIGGVVLGKGSEFDADPQHVKGYLDTGCFELVKR